MPFDQAQWQIDLLAADKTASAFNSVNSRMKQTQQIAAQTAPAMASGFGLVTAAITRLAPALLAAAAAHKVWEAGMKAGGIGEQAEQIGLTTDQLQAYRLAAAQAGVTNEQLDQAMMRLAKAMGTANDGNDEMIARFEKLGVKLLDADGKLRKVSAVAPELARGLMAMGSETERNATMMELFGRSGSRMVTILGDLAQGNEALVASAKAQNAVIGGETIKLWDELGDKLEVAKQRGDTLIATLGRPVAWLAIESLNYQLKIAVTTLNIMQGAVQWLGGVGKEIGQQFEGGSSEDLIKRQETIKATMDALKDSTDALDVARLAGYRQELQRISDILASRAKVYVAPEVTITGDAPGKSQPAGKAATAAGVAQANKALAESQKALDELVAASAKAFDEAKRIMIQYGDGTLYAADANEKLDEALDFIKDPRIVTRAQKEIAEKAADMDRAFRAAGGGWDAFIAGMDQGFAEMERINTEFEIGKKAVDLLGESIDILAGVSNKSFGQMALDFALMVAKMEAAAAASQAWKAIGGASGILSFLGFGGSDALAGIGDSAARAAVDAIGPVLVSARGGPISAGQLGTMGPEELFVPNTGGNVLNSRQLDALGVGRGGGDTIVVNQTVHVGEFVTSTEYRRGLTATKRSAMDGAQQALLARRRRGDPTVKGAF